MAASLKPSSKDPSSSAPPPTADAPRSRSQPQTSPPTPPPPPPAPPLPSQSRSQSKPESKSKSQPKSQKTPVDGKAYYGYLFGENKAPNDTLNALLRALGQHIIDNIGDTNDKQLNAKKLAAFYHAVGGNYDALFKSPDRTLSYIWQALGVQHTLQPVPNNDYASPSIPALTLRGFVRWESLEILLGPEEHVPFLQYAVANWNLKHPYTGEPFPRELPASAFPSVPDAAVDDWHRQCGEKLREAATPNEDDDRDRPPRRHDSDPRFPNATGNGSKSHDASTGPAPQYRPDTEYFRRRRPMSYAHVSADSRYPPSVNHPYHPVYPSHPSHPTMPEANSRVSSSSGSSLEGFTRVRRHSDAKPPPVIVREDTRASAHLDSHSHRPAHTRRHSHTPNYKSPYVASVHDSESESDMRGSPRQPPLSGPSIRRGPVPVGATIPAPVSSRVHRSELRERDDLRAAKPSIPSKIKQLLSSNHRQRSTSGSRDREQRLPLPRHSSSVRYRAKDAPPTRLSRSLSGGSLSSDGSSTEKYGPTSREQVRSRERERDRAIAIEREDRERDRDRERERERRAREWEEELDRKSRSIAKDRDKAYLRPAINRRTSSHADIDRRRGEEVTWDPRDRDRRRESRDLEREVRRNLTGDEMDRERERDRREIERDRRERERRRYDRGGSSPPMQPPVTTGVGGRMYPRGL